jgi:CheY-like chemotaxis protein
MSKKLLLFGNNKAIIDLFFDHLSADFECVTCSARKADLERHMEAFDSDAVIYCMDNENEADFSAVADFKDKYIKTGKHFVIVGSDLDCADYQAKSGAPSMHQIISPDEATLKDRVIRILENRESDDIVVGKAPEVAAGGGWDDILKQLNGEDKKHVLVIDDDPLMLKVIKDYLHEDYEVATAKSGEIAYKFLEKKHTDLILLDYEMPGEKGPDVFKNIRGIAGSENTPILFMTGVKDRERIMEIVKLKPQGYLGKPVERDALYEMIKKVLV